jgi:acyl-CoA thioesterase-1
MKRLFRRFQFVALIAAVCGAGFGPIASFGAEKSSIKARIVILGDSLTEGYGLSKEQAYPARVEKQLNELGYKNVKVINAGVSGSTTAGGASRLDWILRSEPTHVVVALGANDGLRGIKVEQTRLNLTMIIEKLKEKKVVPVLVGMKLPPNYGKEFRAEFDAIFPTLAKKFGITLIPFLLEGVGGVASLNLSDGIHPNEKGHEKLSQTVLPYLEKVIQSK